MSFPQKTTTAAFLLTLMSLPTVNAADSDNNDEPYGPLALIAAIGFIALGLYILYHCYSRYSSTKENALPQHSSGANIAPVRGNIASIGVFRSTRPPMTLIVDGEAVATPSNRDAVQGVAISIPLQNNPAQQANLHELPPAFNQQRFNLV